MAKNKSKAAKAPIVRITRRRLREKQATGNAAELKKAQQDFLKAVGLAKTGTVTKNKT